MRSAPFPVLVSALVACTAMLFAGSARAGIINTYSDKAAFIAGTGASSITGPIPDLGRVGTGPNVVGNLTIDSLSGDLFLGTAGVGGDFETFGWSTLIPGNDIAISGQEDFAVAVNLPNNVSALGFVLHEPTDAVLKVPDGCNFATCPDSTFELTLFAGSTLVDSVEFNPDDDVLTFFGVESDMPFDNAVIDEIVGNADNEYFGEFFATETPEPTTLVLAAIGLAALGFRTCKPRGPSQSDSAPGKPSSS